MIEETVRKDNPGHPKTEHFPISMTKQMNFDALRQQLLTWSAVHTYNEQHSKEANIVDVFMKSLEEHLPTSGKEVNVAWPLGLMLMKTAK